MKKVTLEQKKREGGFTLVELAIVMIIVGLLIGGILKGQELINNSRVTATVAQVKGVDAAISTFRDKFASLPGDMQTPTTRLPNCTAPPCSIVGNGDGIIRASTTDFGTGTIIATGVTGEGVRAYAHLAAADMLSGVDPEGGNVVVPGITIPTAELGGNLRFGHVRTGLSGTTVPLTTAAGGPRNGHYVAISGGIGAVSNNTGILTPVQAAQIDRKLDDGAPDTGSVRATTACSNGGLYDESNDGVTCALYARVQG